MQEILDFLRELEKNNNREWFNTNKERRIIYFISFLGLESLAPCEWSGRDCLQRHTYK